MKRLLIIAALAFVTVIQTKAQSSEIFAPGGKAIKGYDPVAFFKESKPVKGSEKFEYKWKDANWYFASAENLEAFKAEPEKYAPQYGGYCAYGTAQGHKAPTETATWTVLNDKLYFNYSSKVKEAWVKDQTSLLKQADEKWPEVKGQK